MFFQRWGSGCSWGLFKEYSRRQHNDFCCTCFFSYFLTGGSKRYPQTYAYIHMCVLVRGTVTVALTTIAVTGKAVVRVRVTRDKGS